MHVMGSGRFLVPYIILVDFVRDRVLRLGWSVSGRSEVTRSSKKPTAKAGEMGDTRRGGRGDDGQIWARGDDDVIAKMALSKGRKLQHPGCMHSISLWGF